VLIGDFVFAQKVFNLLHVDASSCGNCARHQNVICHFRTTPISNKQDKKD